MEFYLVGGAVRDKLLNLPIKERDWVVVNATPNEMIALGYRQVGKDFPVFLNPKTNEEYALARRERKVGPGYKGFTFDTSQLVKLEEDLARRDLTINAMAESKSGQIIDPYHGKQDLEKKVLRHVSPAFSEDPVRVLRVCRFLARYYHLGFKIAPETLLLMKQMVINGEVNALVPERVWKETERALSEKNPEQFFLALDQCGALPILFPELSLKSTGIDALVTATKHHEATPIRYAVLFFDVTEPKSDLLTLAARLRVPSAYHDLALLTARHHMTMINAHKLTSHQLLDLFYQLDVFRREPRFNQLVTTCAMIAETEKHFFAINWLKECVQNVKSFPVAQLLAQGLSGQELAESLKRQREEIIKDFISTHAATE